MGYAASPAVGNAVYCCAVLVLLARLVTVVFCVPGETARVNPVAGGQGLQQPGAQQSEGALLPGSERCESPDLITTPEQHTPHYTVDSLHAAPTKHVVNLTPVERPAIRKSLPRLLHLIN